MNKSMFTKSFTISIHALREEGDKKVNIFLKVFENFYPRPPRGGRPLPGRAYGLIYNISIHALREEGDSIRPHGQRVDAISIHALREEGDLRMLLNSALISLFLSTPSARRATIPHRKGPLGNNDFYPRPPRGGRLDQQAEIDSYLEISIHALREEGDSRGQQARGVTKVFLSTPSARRATRNGHRHYQKLEISIHALREEGDRKNRRIYRG